MSRLAVCRLVCLSLFIAAFQLTTEINAQELSGPEPGWAEIRVVDAQTDRGIPLVELETVNGLLYVTDNAGRIAFREPDLLGTELFFSLRTHGYQVPVDDLGIAGVRITPQTGELTKVPLQRLMPAERLCRLTGEGLYRDSLLLGYDEPESLPNTRNVAGQDSIQTAIYQGKIYHFWGDTARMNYPLGLFRTAGATTDKPKGDLSTGLAYQYFLDNKTGFPRAMIPFPEQPEGVIWISGITVVPDAEGRERMLCHYSRRKSLVEEIEQGIAVFNDEREIFEPVLTLEKNNRWQKPAGHPIVYEHRQQKWLLYGHPVPNVRIPYRYEAVLAPENYEALSCALLAEDGQTLKPDRNSEGQLQWLWQKKQPPVDSEQEQKWVKAGLMRVEECRSSPRNLEDESEIVQLHSGSVRWNPYRHRWILLAGQMGGKASTLGEVWYAEAREPFGPFSQAIRVATHEKQTFYNVCHHDFLDREQGRLIHFEGTYTNDFSGNAHKTPRYNYNQVLYRLDLEQLARQAGDAATTTQSHASLPWIGISKDGQTFAAEDSERPFTVWGVNYDHDSQGRLLEEYWQQEWTTVVDDFREMKSLGANVIRVHLQLDQFMKSADQPNQNNLDRLKQLVELAEQTGLYLDLTGLGCYHKQNVPEWYETLSETDRWQVQARFWRAIAEVCKNSPAIFCYDLINEPVLPGKEPAKDWLAGELGGKYFVQYLTLDLAGRTREQVAQAWVQQMTSAIREVDSRHLITVGVIPWADVFPGARPIFYSPEVGQHLDFVSVHFYPKTGKLDQSLQALQAYDLGKPLVIEEIFPLGASLEETAKFIDRSAQHCEGWISFYWGKPIPELEQENEMTSQIVAQWLTYFQQRAPQVTGVRSSDQKGTNEK